MICTFYSRYVQGFEKWKGRKPVEARNEPQKSSITVTKISIAILWAAVVTPFCDYAHCDLGTHFSNYMKEGVGKEARQKDCLSG